MKKTLQPAKAEVVVYYDDFTGEPFQHNIPASEVKIACDYGTKQDGETITLHLNQASLDLLLKFISSKKYKGEFKKTCNV